MLLSLHCYAEEGEGGPQREWEWLSNNDCFHQPTPLARHMASTLVQLYQLQRVPICTGTSVHGVHTVGSPCSIHATNTGHPTSWV